ncbi:alpha/beta fold hydrolase [Desulfospira joergensenii]|uniref:alpha/beta fold hydrolase n=1 Tax=Desulfospira joergensenii TaxID=53329 RepID=UPI0013777709|nr:alpha/beta hydrolase [Desulfospira joergensenii]
MKQSKSADPIPDKVSSWCDTYKISYHFNRINNKKIFWIETGKGFPLVLVHGFNASFYTWRFLFKNQVSGFRYIALDLPGFGCSESDMKKNGNIGVYADVINEFLKFNAIKEAVLIGHSFGGLLCQYFVQKYYYRTKAVVLVAPAIPGNVRPPKKVEKGFMLYSYHNPRVLMPQDFDMFKAIGLKTPKALLKIKKFPKWSGSHEISIPCLVVWGKKDLILPIENIEDLKSRFSNVEIAELEDAGHCLHEEKPKLFETYLIYFISSILNRNADKLISVKKDPNQPV